jgi:hypothetical protein
LFHRYMTEVTASAEPRVASRPMSEHTERGYSVNFDRAANTVAFDVEGDEKATMGAKKNRMKWDRKKKKYVQEGSVNAVKHIRTESGNLIKVIDCCVDLLRIHSLN